MMAMRWGHTDIITLLTNRGAKLEGVNEVR